MTNIEIIQSQDVKEIKKIFKRPTFQVEQVEAIKQYKVKDHEIFDLQKRPIKVIKKGTGEMVNGVETTTTMLVEPARIAIPFQKLIVNRRVGFMLTIPVETKVVWDTGSENEKQLVKMVEALQHDNKMDYKNKELARRMMSEMECAEVWYFVKSGEVAPAPEYTLKCNIWSPDLGDVLYPLFDAYGSMTAFARGYKLKENDKDIEHFDVYTPEFEYKYVLREGVWSLDVLTDSLGATIPNPIPNTVGKIMIVYHTQPAPEWTDVASMISRLETSKSNHADMNDYFGSPILAVEGEVRGFAQKGEQGKIMELMEGSKAAYLALNSEPQSIKMEQDCLKEDIYTMSQTPDISFKTMSGMGTIAQFTMKAFFMDAHMAVSQKEEIFGIGLQRRLNILKAAIGMVIDTKLSKESQTVQLTPVITPYLPANDTESIDNLTVAVTGGIMSKETAMELNPLVEDSEVELERMKSDATSELAGTENIPPPEKKPILQKTGNQ
jgi:SPP1 family phage portal protein